MMKEEKDFGTGEDYELYLLQQLYYQVRENTLKRTRPNRELVSMLDKLEQFKFGNPKLDCPGRSRWDKEKE